MIDTIIAVMLYGIYISDVVRTDLIGHSRMLFTSLNRNLIAQNLKDYLLVSSGSYTFGGEFFTPPNKLTVLNVFLFLQGVQLFCHFVLLLFFHSKL